MDSRVLATDATDDYGQFGPGMIGDCKQVLRTTLPRFTTQFNLTLKWKCWENFPTFFISDRECRQIIYSENSPLDFTHKFYVAKSSLQWSFNCALILSVYKQTSTNWNRLKMQVEHIELINRLNYSKKAFAMVLEIRRVLCIVFGIWKQNCHFEPHQGTR